MVGRYKKKAKVGHVRHISAFRAFSGFIIALRNIPEKFRKKSSGNVIIYQYCYCIVIMFFKYKYFLTQISKRFASYRHFDRGNSD
jgi:hypothetical protein